MNALLANILRDKIIESQDWMDVSAGLVKDFERVIATPARDGKVFKVRKKYPVSCDYTSEDCEKGKYKNLIPATTKRCITYFEDLGAQPTGRQGDVFKFTSGLRLVCWFNMNRFAVGGACSFSNRLIVEILSKLPLSPFNDSGLTKIQIGQARIVPKTAAIFSRYTYDEPIMQYLLYPYDYFAIDFKIDYEVDHGCFDPISTDEADCTPLESATGYVPPAKGSFSRHINFYTDPNLMEYEIPELDGMEIDTIQFGSLNLTPNQWEYIGTTFRIIDPNSDTDGGIYINIEYHRP